MQENVNAWSGRFCYPLQAAAFPGYTKVVDMLTRKGANVKAEAITNQVHSMFKTVNKLTPRIMQDDTTGTTFDYPFGTALSAASFNGYIDVMQLLIANGAIVNTR